MLKPEERKLLLGEVKSIAPAKGAFFVYGKEEGLDKQIQLLEKIQKIDLEISEIVNKNAIFPLEIDKFEKTVADVKEEIENAREEIKISHLEQKRLQGEIDLEREKIKRDQERLKHVTSEKEYKALLKEIETSKKTIEKKEEEILTAMENIDNKGSFLEEKEKTIKILIRNLDEKKAEANKEKEILDKELEEKRKVRMDVTKDILPQLLRRYEYLKEKRQGVAVVPVKDGNCFGCYMSLPPQIYIQVQKRDEVVFCPHCHRILYWDRGGK